MGIEYCVSDMIFKDGAEAYIASHGTDYIILDTDKMRLLCKFCECVNLGAKYIPRINSKLTATLNNILYDGHSVAYGEHVGIAGLAGVLIACVFSYGDVLIVAIDCVNGHMLFLMVSRETLELMGSYSAWMQTVNSEVFVPLLMRMVEVDFGR